MVDGVAFLAPNAGMQVRALFAAAAAAIGCAHEAPQVRSSDDVVRDVAEVCAKMRAGPPVIVRDRDPTLGTILRGENKAFLEGVARCGRTGGYVIEITAKTAEDGGFLDVDPYRTGGNEIDNKTTHNAWASPGAATQEWLDASLKRLILQDLEQIDADAHDNDVSARALALAADDAALCEALRAAPVTIEWEEAAARTAASDDVMATLVGCRSVVFPLFHAKLSIVTFQSDDVMAWISWQSAATDRIFRTITHGATPDPSDANMPPLRAAVTAALAALVATAEADAGLLPSAAATSRLSPSAAQAAAAAAQQDRCGKLAHVRVGLVVDNSSGDELGNHMFARFIAACALVSILPDDQPAAAVAAGVQYVVAAHMHVGTYDAAKAMPVLSPGTKSFQLIVTARLVSVRDSRLVTEVSKAETRLGTRIDDVMKGVRGDGDVDSATAAADDLIAALANDLTIER